MVALSVIRTVRIQNSQQGADEVIAKQRGIAGAQGDVAVATDRTTKSQLSASRGLEAMQRSLDVNFRMAQDLAKAESTLARARDQGLIGLEREAELLTMARQRYDGTVSSLENLKRSLDSAYRSEQDLAKTEAQLGQARARGLIDVTEEARLLGLARAQSKGLGDEHAKLSTQSMAASHAARGMVEQLAMGVSPMQALTAQMNHLSFAASGEGGLVGAFKSIGASLAPMLTVPNLVTIGLIGLTAVAGTLWDSLAGQSEKKAEEALKRQQQLVDRIADAYPRAGQALKDYLALADDMTPTQIVVATQSQIEDAQRQLKAAKDKLDAAAFSGLKDSPFGGQTNPLMVMPQLRAELQGIVTEFDHGALSASRMRDELAKLQLDPSLGGLAPALLKSFSDIADQIARAEVTAQAFSSTLDAMRAGGGPIISGDFSQLGGTTQKAFEALQSVLDAGVSEKDKLRKLVEQGIGGATSAGDADRLQTMLTQAIKVLDQKAGDKTADTLRKAYTDLTRSAGDFVEQQNLSIRIYGLSADAAARLTHEQDLLNKAEAAHIKLTPDQRRELVSLADGMADAEVRAKSYTQTMDALADTLASMFSKPITDAQQFFDTILGGFGSLGQANLKAGLQSLLSGHAFDATSGGSQGAGGLAGGLVPGVSQILDHLPDKVGAGVKGGLAQFMKDNAKTIGAAAGGLGVGYQTQNPLMGALGGALGGLASGDPIQAVVGGIAGFIGGLIGMNEALEKARKTLDDNRASIDQFIATGLGKTLDADTVALAQFKAQGAQLVQVAQAAGDAQLVANLNAAMDAYKDTLAASHVQDQIDQNRKDLIDSYHDQVSALQSVIDANRSFISSIEQFKGTLKLDKSFSPLSPEAMLEEAQRQFNLILNKARLGDINAQGQLQGAASSYLGAAQGYLGSSDRYVGIFNQVEDALGQVVDTAQTRIDGTEAQLEATNQSLQILGDIHSTAMDQLTELQTISKLTAAASQVNSDAIGGLQTQIADLTRAINNANLRRAS